MEEKKKEHRVAHREYSGQAPILRLQQLPLTMAERRRIEKGVLVDARLEPGLNA